MSQKGNSIKLKNGLTPKQNKFTKLIIEDIANGRQPNVTEAALQTYDTKDKAVAAGIAGENLQKPTIKEVIKKALEAEGWNPTENLKNIRKLGNLVPEKPTVSGILQANIQLLKLTGNYPGSNHDKAGMGSSTTIINLTYNEAKEKITELSSNSQDFINDAEAN